MTSQTTHVYSNQGQIVVANRASGDLSILDASTGVVIGVVPLPTADDDDDGDDDGEATSDPTYVTYTPHD